MTHFVHTHDARFSKWIISHARLDLLWSGGRWLEGPAWFAAGRYLVFSDIPNNRLLRYDDCNGQVAVFREPSGNANGNTVDAQGRLLSCEHLHRRVTRTGHDGSVSALAERFEGKRLNSPNDLVLHPDGSVWFTDPSYGIDSDYEGERAVSELDGCHVYRLDPQSGKLTAVVTDRVRPNGLAFSPDHKCLYVSDTGASHVPGLAASIHAYPIEASQTAVGPARLFCEYDRGFFDGFRVDASGNLWSSAGKGVNCYDPDGTLLGRIDIPELVSNLCFGGPKRNRLFITAQTSLYALYVNARGL